MNNLEIAKQKLERLEKEQLAVINMTREEVKRIPLGQPNIEGRRDIYKDLKKYDKKAKKLQTEIDEQKIRIDKLEKVHNFKNDNELLQDIHVVGKSSYATVGAKTSVNNIVYFEDKLQKLEEKNRLAKEYNKNREKGSMKCCTYGAEITKLKNKIEYLKKMQEQAFENENTMSEKTKTLIESGAVNQWKKKPIYYFVQGLQKVALTIDESGEFVISPRYAPTNDEDKAFVEELLK